MSLPLSQWRVLHHSWCSGAARRPRCRGLRDVNLLHVVPHISEEASGPSYSVPRLCEVLVKQGATVELSCLEGRTGSDGVHVNVHRQWPIVRRFAISSEFVGFLRNEGTRFDIVHNHSLWSMVNVATDGLYLRAAPDWSHHREDTLRVGLESSPGGKAPPLALAAPRCRTGRPAARHMRGRVSRHQGATPHGTGRRDPEWRRHASNRSEQDAGQQANDTVSWADSPHEGCLGTA